MTIAERLATLRRERGLSQGQLAKLAGVSQQLISQIEQGLNSSTKNLPQIAAALRCNVADIDDAYSSEPAPRAFTVKAEGDVDLIPVYNVAASAGPGAMVDWEEEVVERLAFPQGYLRHITSVNPIHLKIISVKGRSMEPTLREDDVVMIDVSKRDLSYEGIFVIQDGGHSMLVKRISRASRKGFVMLVSDNRDHPPVERALEDIAVIGKVVWAGVKM